MQDFINTQQILNNFKAGQNLYDKRELETVNNLHDISTGDNQVKTLGRPKLNAFSDLCILYCIFAIKTLLKFNFVTRVYNKTKSTQHSSLN